MARFSGDPAFDRYVTEQGEAFVGYATFCARREPGTTTRPRAASTCGCSGRSTASSRSASRELPLVHDLAVGVDPDGADAWVDRDAYAHGVSVGAPPDEFNTAGQDWGLLPFDPWRLRAAGYEPFIQTVRAGFRHAGGLRVDHVMGLFRLFWVPAGCGPEEGTYVRYPAADLLDILAVESHRAGAFVVGEDLGTVEDEVRAELARRRVLSYRLLYFEPGDPSTLPSNALAAVTTHDLPTIAGLWSGHDLVRQHEAGMQPNVDGAARLRARIRSLAGVDDGAPLDDVVAGTYRALRPCPVGAAGGDARRRAGRGGAAQPPGHHGGHQLVDRAAPSARRDRARRARRPGGRRAQAVSPGLSLAERRVRGPHEARRPAASTPSEMPIWFMT